MLEMAFKWQKCPVKGYRLDSIFDQIKSQRSKTQIGVGIRESFLRFKILYLEVGAIKTP